MYTYICMCVCVCPDWRDFYIGHRHWNSIRRWPGSQVVSPEQTSEERSEERSHLSFGTQRCTMGGELCEVQIRYRNGSGVVKIMHFYLPYFGLVRPSTLWIEGHQSNKIRDLHDTALLHTAKLISERHFSPLGIKIFNNLLSRTPLIDKWYLGGPLILSWLGDRLMKYRSTRPRGRYLWEDTAIQRGLPLPFLWWSVLLPWSCTLPPAPMNHVKYLRAGPAEMPFRNWYTANTNHFHLTHSVEIKNQTRLSNKSSNAWSCAEDQILEN